MRSILFLILVLTLMTLVLSVPVLTIAGPDEVLFEAMVTMEITGMT